MVSLTDLSVSVATKSGDNNKEGRVSGLSFGPNSLCLELKLTSFT